MTRVSEVAVRMTQSVLPLIDGSLILVTYPLRDRTQALGPAYRPKPKLWKVVLFGDRGPFIHYNGEVANTTS